MARNCRIAGRVTRRRRGRRDRRVVVVGADQASAYNWGLSKLSPLVVGETSDGAVGQPVGVEMVFRHIDADGIVLHLSMPLLVIRGSPPGIRSGQRKRRGRSNSSSTRQTVSVLPIRPSPLTRGQPPSPSGPSRLLGAKSHKTSKLGLGRTAIVIASEAKQSRSRRAPYGPGSPRRFAPRDDDSGRAQPALGVRREAAGPGLPPNKSKETQRNPRKKAWISLDSFGRIWTYQWVTTNPNKIFSRVTLCLKTRNRLFRSAPARPRFDPATGQIYSMSSH